MIKALLFDFSRVILNPKNKTYAGSLNSLHKKLSKENSYQFFDHFELNDELLDFLKDLKKVANINFYVFTTGTIQNVPEIKPIVDTVFNKIYSVENLNLPKTSFQAYLSIAKDLNIKPDEILFIDDAQENLCVAQQADLKTIHYQSNEQLFTDIKEMLSNKASSIIEN